jgi:myo-inositol-1-phosphate synthase
MSPKVRVGIVGVGNCATALIQGVQYYHDADPDDVVPGLMHVELGGIHVRDIEFVSAFDVEAEKIGCDLGGAIWAGHNQTFRFAQVPPLNVTVERGPTMDGLGTYLHDLIRESDSSPVDVVRVLRETNTEVLVNYLPVGSEEATRFYAQCALEAGCAFVNCIPVFIASDADWARRFREAKLPIIGDDIKSQVGATIVHRVLTNLLKTRGIKLTKTSQLNVGGNTDFYNMLDRGRLQSKKISKTQAVTSQTDPIDAYNVHVGPSDHVAWLEDRKWAHIYLEGAAFGDAPLRLDVKLEVHDSPNSAGIVIDAVRCAKLALENGVGGSLDAPSSYFMKSPPVQYTDSEARELVEAFITKYAMNGH